MKIKRARHDVSVLGLIAAVSLWTGPCPAWSFHPTDLNVDQLCGQGMGGGYKLVRFRDHSVQSFYAAADHWVPGPSASSQELAEAQHAWVMERSGPCGLKDGQGRLLNGPEAESVLRGIQNGRRERFIQGRLERSAAALTAGPVPSGESAAGSEGRVWDPLRPVNEKIFWLDIQVDNYAMQPVAKGYQRIVPESLRHGVSNAFYNLRGPERFANDLLQLDVRGGAREAARFALNSTVGIAGFIDVAGHVFGIAKGDGEDFGQTLGYWGVPPGPYIALPVTEPMVLRDIAGKFADGMLYPLGFVLGTFERIGPEGAEVISDRTARPFGRNDPKEVYEATRDAYFQRRQEEIRR